MSTADAAVADFGAPCLTLVLMIRFGLAAAAAAAAAAGSVMVGMIGVLWHDRSIDRPRQHDVRRRHDASISCRTLAQLLLSNFVPIER